MMRTCVFVRFVDHEIYNRKHRIRIHRSLIHHRNNSIIKLFQIIPRITIRPYRIPLYNLRKFELLKTQNLENVLKTTLRRPLSFDPIIFFSLFKFSNPILRKSLANEKIPRMVQIKRKVCAFFCFSGMLEAWAVIWEAAALATVAAC